MDLFRLPEFLHLLGGFLSTADLAQCTQVSHLWHATFIPHLWRHMDDTSLQWDKLFQAVSFDLHGILPYPTIESNTPNTSVPISELPIRQARKELRALFFKYGHYIRTLVATWPLTVQFYSESRLVDWDTNRNGNTGLKVLDVDICRQFRRRKGVLRFDFDLSEKDDQGDKDPVGYSCQNHEETGQVELMGDRVLRLAQMIIKSNTGTLQKIRMSVWDMDVSFPKDNISFFKMTLPRLENLTELDIPLTVDLLAALPQWTPKLESLHLDIDNLDLILCLDSPSWRKDQQGSNCLTCALQLKALYLHKGFEPWHLGAILTLCPSLETLGLGSSEVDGWEWMEHDIPMKWRGRQYRPGAFPNLRQFIAGFKDNQDAALAFYLRWFPHLRYLNCRGLGPVSLQAVQDYCLELEKLVLGVLVTKDEDYGVDWKTDSVDFDQTGEPEEGSLNHILASLPCLCSFTATKGMIAMEEIKKEPWVCLGLRYLHCSFSLPGRYSREMFLQDGGVYIQGHSITPPGVPAVEKLSPPRLFTNNVLLGHWVDSKRHHELLFNQLAKLTELEFLHLGRDEQVSKQKPWTIPMMNLEMGLGMLCGLKKLKVMGCDNMQKDMGQEEVEWIVRHWPRLERVYGLECKGVEIAEEAIGKRREVRQWMCALKPGIEFWRFKKALGQ